MQAGRPPGVPRMLPMTSVLAETCPRAATTGRTLGPSIVELWGRPQAWGRQCARPARESCRGDPSPAEPWPTCPGLGGLSGALGPLRPPRPGVREVVLLRSLQGAAPTGLGTNSAGAPSLALSPAPRDGTVLCCPRCVWGQVTCLAAGPAQDGPGSGWTCLSAGASGEALGLGLQAEEDLWDCAVREGLQALPVASVSLAQSQSSCFCGMPLGGGPLVSPRLSQPGQCREVSRSKLVC